MDNEKTISNKTGLDKAFNVMASAVAIALCLFHLLAASPFLTLNNTEQSVYHGALIIAFFLLVRSKKSAPGKIFDLLLIALTVVAAHEVIVLRNSNVATTMLYTDFQKIVSVLFVCAAIYISYRALGSILPGLCLLFLVYTFYGSYLPGTLETSRVSVYRMATYLMVSSEGLFGSALNVAAIYIFLFVLFGSVLSFIGAGEFFVEIASAAFGHFVGGPAQAAVYSSMLLGMVNGSGAATVVTAGTFTIPLMKKTGFDNDTAGGIVATAASGGQIMPPVMGAVAFLMADATSIPYGTICLAALIPAILYYLTTSAGIISYAHRHKVPAIKRAPGDPTVGQIFKKGWFYFVPIFLLIGLMISGMSTARAALYTILVCIVIGLITNPKKFTFKNIVAMCRDAAESMMSVSIACMVVGIVVGAINITGLGLKISTIITMLAGGSVLVMGLLTAVVCIILGMGLPTSACYIILSVLVAPAMVKLGVSMASAHLFVLYFGVIAAITPPVALAVFAAIGISGGDMWKTGLQAVKFAIAGFLIPFVFLYNNNLVMFHPATATFGIDGGVILTFVLTAIGVCFLSCAVFGWLLRDLKAVERIVLAVACILTLCNHILPLGLAGLAAVVVLTVFFKMTAGKQKEVPAI
ncbi:MAG: TRAP transporter fused permease subunit [Oscillospiraceae bacterium]|nr:TRAP transporter fused permease subunit [Oscillospiraceae bacterium]